MFGFCNSRSQQKCYYIISLPFDIRPGSKMLFEFCKIYGHLQGDVWLMWMKIRTRKKIRFIRAGFLHHRFTCLRRLQHFLSSFFVITTIWKLFKFHPESVPQFLQNTALFYIFFCLVFLVFLSDQEKTLKNAPFSFNRYPVPGSAGWVACVRRKLLVGLINSAWGARGASVHKPIAIHIMINRCRGQHLKGQVRA